MSQIEINKLPHLNTLWQQTLNWQPNTEQEELFQQVYQEILEGNRYQNLTRITTPENFWEKHLWDSLSGIVGLKKDEANQRLEVIDIGTGAGFPGIPLAIAFPNWKVTLLDSTRKKISFVNDTIAKLGIDNATGIIARAEALGRITGDRQSYDIATIRAVSKPSVCLEYALPLVKIGGLAILYRGHWSKEDTSSLKYAAGKLGSKVESIYPWETPLTQGVRHCIYLRKHSGTSKKYPRDVGIPDKQPL